MRANIRRGWAGAAALGLCALAFGSQPLSAQSSGSLRALFDILGGSALPPAAAPNRSMFDSPSAPAPYGLSITVTPHPLSGSGGIAYCVRLCDGRYFPLPRTLTSTRRNRTDLCNVLCPASPTRVYSGASIEHAVDVRGGRYGQLKSAFRFRDVADPNCTCNGRDMFGTAAVDINSDMTLRAGDFIVAEGGFMVFQRWRKDANKAAEFVPVTKQSLLQKLWRTPAGGAIPR